jgi:hypothetical protein
MTRSTVQLMTAERDRIDQRILDLQRTRDTLDEVISAATGSIDEATG